MRRARASIGVLGLVLVTAGCSRTPPEPAPAATVRSEPAPRAAAPAAAPARCISALPAVAPSIPRPADAARCPVDPEPNAALPRSEVAFPETPSLAPVEVELAKTPHDIEKGLMFRRSMPEAQGMLFRLDGRREHTFWMHNTCIPLDMLFIDDDGLIVGIVEGAAPLTDDVRSVGCPSSYVLEMNAGWARRHGVKPGQKVGIPFSAR